MGHAHGRSCCEPARTADDEANASEGRSSVRKGGVVHRGRGLWSNTYRFHFPVHLETKDFRRYISLYGIARGEIKIPEKAYKVTCTNCRYYEEESIIRANYEGKNPRFSFSFKIKRTPYKAMVVYLIMLAGIFSYVIRRRAAM